MGTVEVIESGVGIRWHCVQEMLLTDLELEYYGCCTIVSGRDLIANHFATFSFLGKLPSVTDLGENDPVSGSAETRGQAIIEAKQWLESSGWLDEKETAETAEPPASTGPMPESWFAKACGTREMVGKVMVEVSAQHGGAAFIFEQYVPTNLLKLLPGLDMRYKVTQLDPITYKVHGRLQFGGVDVAFIERNSNPDVVDELVQCLNKARS